MDEHFELNRKLSKIGPHRPCGSIAKGRSIIFCRIRSPLTASPCIEVELSFTSFLLMRLNFLFSNFWRCASAKAKTEDITSSEKLKEEGGVAL